ncbi:MAG TPA: hypothetical protein PLF76_05265, partial [Methanomassiliicoccaceae archaeon]|nr:hypothetical protein [Methanomassiliicoccaceae archaeon]
MRIRAFRPEALDHEVLERMEGFRMIDAASVVRFRKQEDRVAGDPEHLSQGPLGVMQPHQQEGATSRL